MYRAHILAFSLIFLALIAHGQATLRPPQGAFSRGDDAPPSSSPSLENARKLAASGHLEDAMVQLNELASQVPEPAGVERLRGNILYGKEEFSEAASAFARAVTQDPSDRESTGMEGLSLFRLGHSKEALPLLEKARGEVDVAGNDSEYVLGLCYAEAGRYDDARTAFAKQYGFNADSAEAYVLAARLFFRRKHFKEASTQAHKALDMKPTLPLVHQLLGEIDLANDNLPEAINELETESSINPMNGGTYERLGDALLRSNRLAESQQALERAILLEPATTSPYILLGQLHLLAKQPVRAIQYLILVARMDPSNFRTHFLLAHAYKETGQVAESDRELKIYKELQQNQEPHAPEK